MSRPLTQSSIEAASRVVTLCVLLVAGCNHHGRDSKGSSGEPQSALQLAQSIPAQFQTEIQQAVSQLSNDSKTAIADALVAEPFPQQQVLIMGAFHGKHNEDEFESYYQYVRLADGTGRHTTIDIDPTDQFFQRTDSRFRWHCQGRVLFEQDLNNPRSVELLILRSLNQDEIGYQLIQSGPEDQHQIVHRRGSTELPEKPEDWPEY